jgi:hypothetical protein
MEPKKNQKRRGPYKRWESEPVEKEPFVASNPSDEGNLNLITSGETHAAENMHQCTMDVLECDQDYPQTISTASKIQVHFILHFILCIIK